MSPVQLGQYPPARQVIVHVSDTHLLASGARLHGTIDSLTNLRRALGQIAEMDIRPSALVFTGDLTDLGEPGAYRDLREAVEPVASALGAEVVWVPGNHDELPAWREHLVDAPASGTADAPWDTVTELDGLRIIGLDTSVPGFHHGDLTAAQLDWLSDVLAAPAPRGSILALHHPPAPSFLPLFDLLELRDQSRLEEVLRGSDVRAILGGHLHYSTFTTFAGIPLSVSSASCYAMDISRPPRQVYGMDGGQGFSLVHVYDDRITHSRVPLGDFPPASSFAPDLIDRMEALSPEERVEAFSRKPVPGNPE